MIVIEKEELLQIDLLTPLRAELFLNEEEWEDREYDSEYGETLDGADLAQYEESITAMVEKENLMGGQDEPCNLMHYFDGSPSIKEKVISAIVSVKNVDGVLYGCTTLQLHDFLETEELKELCEYITGQYRDGWGEGFEQRDIAVDGGTLNVHFWQNEDFHIQEKQSESKSESSIAGIQPQKKYEITDIRHPKYPWLHRIKALIPVNERVSTGELGGFVESEENLSQEGSCWLHDASISCEDAVVAKEAGLFDGAVARGSALVSGDCNLFDRALAEGNAILTSGEVKEDARVAGNAMVGKNAAQELSPLISGHSHVYGEVSGWFVIKDTVLPGEKLDNPTPDMFLLENGERNVLVKQRGLKNPNHDDRQKQKSNRKER